jgi:alanine racemase
MKTVSSAKKNGESLYNCWVEVDLGAITHNVRTLKEVLEPNRLLMACVKAEGYGHGMVPVAIAALAGGADRLCVAELEEGVKLRQAGITFPIQILNQPDAASALDLIHYDLIPSLSTPEIVLQLAKNLPSSLKIHVEIDTGMKRVALKPDGAVDFLNLVKSTGKFKVEGMFSHFSNSHNLNDPASRKITLNQLNLFKKTVANCRKAGHRLSITHIANSGVVSCYPEAYLEMIRSGYLIYGMLQDWIELPLKAALSFKSRVNSIVKIKAGESIGYNRTYIAPEDTRAAIVSCGYAHGYPHMLSNKSQALVRNCRAQVVGLVSMNQMVIDIGCIPGVSVGDEVVLVGTQGENSITALDLSRHFNAPAVAITCGISYKVPRIYLPPDSNYRIEGS